MGSDQLCRHHALQLVFRTDPDQRANGGVSLPVLSRRVRLLQPQGLHRLIGEHGIQAIRV